MDSVSRLWGAATEPHLESASSTSLRLRLHCLCKFKWPTYSIFIVRRLLTIVETPENSSDSSSPSLFLKDEGPSQAPRKPPTTSFKTGTQNQAEPNAVPGRADLSTYLPSIWPHKARTARQRNLKYNRADIRPARHWAQAATPSSKNACTSIQVDTMRPRSLIRD